MPRLLRYASRSIKSTAPEGRQGNRCEAGSVALVGDVSLDDGLQTLAPRKVTIGQIARERGVRIKGGRSNAAP
jgi:hypothetical protein